MDFLIDLSNFWYPLDTDIEYLIGKFSVIINMNQEGFTLSICLDVMNSSNLLYKQDFIDSQIHLCIKIIPSDWPY